MLKEKGKMGLNAPFPVWRVSREPVLYPEALAEMESHVNAMLAGEAQELFWLLEHPPLYTAGTSARAEELMSPDRFPVFETGRGGKHTYHGPGQRVIYAMLNLAQRDRDLRAHVWRLEEWIIRVLQDFDVRGERRKGRVGIWVEQRGEEKKIAALGVRCRRWVTSHGLALNVNPNLSHFDGIVPCGLREYGVTSLHDLGVRASMAEIGASFKRQGKSLF